jgi:hypothetical protein
MIAINQICLSHEHDQADIHDIMSLLPDTVQSKIEGVGSAEKVVHNDYLV